MSNRKTDKSSEQKKKQGNLVQFEYDGKALTQAALLIPYQTKRHKNSNPDQNSHPLEQRINEAVGLANAIELDLKSTFDIQIESPRPATFFGKGKVEELKYLIELAEIELVIIDSELSPGQQRNLEKQWDVKVLDRTNLILEIFGRRAVTREGRLQVELAHLNYQKSRLVRSWTHLERQRGGKGFLGGPGETQIESDRRQIQARILRLTKDLEKVKKTREQHRKKRRQIPFPIVAIVGYTNAGKSTLFNKLTGAKVAAKDQLFATLDPTMRAITLPLGSRVILSDTVGFVSNLPTQLIAAFRATLEEVIEADLILHVQDAASPGRLQQRQDVIKVLSELGIKPSTDAAPIYEVWNKTDLIPPDDKAFWETEFDNDTGDQKIFKISAQSGAGIDDLLQAIEAELQSSQLQMQLTLGTNDGELIGWLYKNRCVTAQSSSDNGDIIYDVTIPRTLAGNLQRKLKAANKIKS